MGDNTRRSSKTARAAAALAAAAALSNSAEGLSFPGYKACGIAAAGSALTGIPPFLGSMVTLTVASWNEEWAQEAGDEFSAKLCR